MEQLSAAMQREGQREEDTCRERRGEERKRDAERVREREERESREPKGLDYIVKGEESYPGLESSG